MPTMIALGSMMITAGLRSLLKPAVASGHRFRVLAKPTNQKNSINKVLLVACW